MTKNLVNGKIYVGIHTKNNPKYLGSGTYLCLAIKKYGRDNFQRTTIDEFDDLEVGVEKERYWIAKLNSKWPAGYNLNDGGEGQFNPCDELRKRMSLSRIGKKRTNYNLTPEGRARLAAATSARLKGKPGPMVGKRHTAEAIAKMSAFQKARCNDPEERKRLSAIRKGRPGPTRGRTLPESWRHSLSVSHRGHKDSEETKSRKSISATRAWAVRKYGEGGVPLSTE